VYSAMLEASTTSAVQLRGSSVNGTASTTAGRLLYSRLLPTGDGSLGATLMALNMEFSSGGLRNSGQTALIGVHFDTVAPANMTTDDFRVHLTGGRSTAVRIMDLSGYPQGKVLAASVPQDYKGKARPCGCTCVVSPVYAISGWHSQL
jgi:hypothetical protein